jgi:Flp pilus assembly pilin Flp
MRDIVRNLWTDDNGALIATEWLFIATIMVIGLVVGLVYIRNAVTSKQSEFAQATRYVNVSYMYPGLAGKFAFGFSGPLATTPASNVQDLMTPLWPIAERLPPVPVIVSDDPQM